MINRTADAELIKK